MSENVGLHHMKNLLTHVCRCLKIDLCKLLRHSFVFGRMKLYCARDLQFMCLSMTWWQKRILLFPWRTWCHHHHHPLRIPEMKMQWTVKPKELGSMMKQSAQVLDRGAVQHKQPWTDLYIEFQVEKEWMVDNWGNRQHLIGLYIREHHLFWLVLSSHICPWI